MSRGWQPRLGAIPGAAGTTFRVWAPTTTRVDLVVAGDKGPVRRPMHPEGGGMFVSERRDVRPGDRYRFMLDDREPLPDPASRSQPDGVHGDSVVVDPLAFPWTDAAWAGCPLGDTVLYELHVGTFTPPGTFAGVVERLPSIAELGVTAIELMPVADFPGRRNWGYDGAALFAPSRAYGGPDDFRRLVDASHAAGLAVWLDVVYNHMGPDGAYVFAYSPHYFTDRHRSPWGAGVNLDGPHSRAVREFFIENALHWVHEYHVDGLRLDATHAIADDGPRHFLAELADRIRESCPGRRVLVVAEDDRNLATLVAPPEAGGCGLDGVWADDFHHEVRRLLAGDADGYYRDFRGTTADLAAIVRQGWLYTGQHSLHFGGPRGTDPGGIDAARFVICLENHDQVGNRARGDRLHHGIELAAYRAASVLLLTAPETPLLFMGQEWAAGTPFQYFTDHEPELGRKVTEGRRREFSAFTAFAATGDDTGGLPDPQDDATFAESRLDWTELEREPHASIRRLYAAVLALRGREPALRRSTGTSFDAVALDEDTVAVRRVAEGDAIVVVARLRGAGAVALEPVAGGVAADADWRCLLTTEDARFSAEPEPPVLHLGARPPRIGFSRPGAVVIGARGLHGGTRAGARP